MADITLRSVKGTPLTNAEVDANFSNLNTDVASRALATHNHNSTYLGITAKAADSELLDGFNSTAFLRSVNGVTPDGDGNVAVNVDLSSRVAKAGDTMTGPLTLSGNPTNNLHAAPKQYVDSAISGVDLSTRVAKSGDTMTGNLTIQNTAPTINMADTNQGTTRYLHVNDNLMGFLNTGGGWDMYANNSGQVWTSNYGWLHDYFFRSVGNCAGGYGMGNEVVSNCGNIVLGTRIELVDDGGNLRLRTAQWNTNCNCK